MSAFLPGSLRAQAPPPPPPADAAQSAPQKLPPEALNELLAPIALYPDALIALILPASTVPSDVVLAARYLSSNGDAAQVAQEPWDDSVKALVRYPEIVKWMDENLEWTTQVGELFLDQPAEVMNTIQQLRAQARAAGNLFDTPQQRIVEEEASIRIVPAEPEMIYVPRYDPEVVYVRPYAPHLGPVVTFGVGFVAGSWLRYDCDWHRRKVCVGDWKPGWKHDWERGDKDAVRTRVNVVHINKNTAREWQPSARIQRQHWERQRTVTDVNVKARARTDSDAVERRLSTVVKPSRQDFDGRTDDDNRKVSRRSERGVSERVEKWKERKKEKENGDDQSKGNIKRQSLTVKEKTWEGKNIEARKREVDYTSEKTNRSSDEDQPRAHRLRSQRSQATDSPQEFKKRRTESVESEGASSEVRKHSRSLRIERTKEVSRDNKPNKAKHDGDGNKRGGESGKKGDGKQEDKGDD